MPFFSWLFPCTVRKTENERRWLPKPTWLLKTGHRFWLLLLEGLSPSCHVSLSQQPWLPGLSLCRRAGSERRSQGTEGPGRGLYLTW